MDKRDAHRSRGRGFSVALASLIVLLLGPNNSLTQAAEAGAGQKLFGLTNLWTLRIKVTREDWRKLERQAPFTTNQLRRTNGLLRTRGERFDYVRAEVEIAGQVFKDVGLRHKGNGAFGNAPKHAFKIEFDKYVKGQGVDGITKVSLNNNVYDTSYMREALSYDLFRQAKVPAPRTAFVKVFLDVPGMFAQQYLGLYTMVESVEGRFLKAHFGDKEGLLLKPDLGNRSPYLGEKWADYEKPYQQKTKAPKEATDRFMRYTRLVNQGDAASFRAQIGNYINVDEFLRFLAVNTVLANLDSFLGMGKNFYVYEPPGSKRLQWLPWDMDLSLGGYFFCGTVEQRINLSVRHPYSCGDPLVERLLAIPEMETKYRAHLEWIISTWFLPARVEANIDAIARAIRDAVVTEGTVSAERFERSIWGMAVMAEPSPQRPRNGGAILEPPLKTFARQRVESIRRQLKSEEPGDQVSFWKR